MVVGKPRNLMNFKVARTDQENSTLCSADSDRNDDQLFPLFPPYLLHYGIPDCRIQSDFCIAFRRLLAATAGLLGKGKDKENMACLEGDCECRPHKDVKSSSIAIKAAQEAKEAQEAQQIAGAQAAHQVKCQLAEKAGQAARAAEAALSGKQVMVDQLEHEVREAEAVVQEEAASCQQTQMNLQVSLASAAQAGHLLKTLTAALQISQSNLANSQQAAEGAQQELAEKAALLDAAKCRVDALLRELSVARQDLCAIKQAAYKAQTAARNAECNAQRNRRRLQRSFRRTRRRANHLRQRIKVKKKG